MTINRWIMMLGLVGLGALNLNAKDKNPKMSYGFVNFENCITNSLRGKKERELLDRQRVEIEKVLKDLEAQLNDTHKKRNDQDYLDALSPQAIDELNQTYQLQIEEIKKAQSQYYQVLQQAQGRMYTVLHSDVKKASEKVAKDRNLDAVMHSEAVFFSTSDLDVTDQVIREMDTLFNQESK